MNNKKVHSATSNYYQLWHQRLGHMGKSKFLELKKKNKKIKKNKVDDINLINNIILSENICEACMFRKQARSFFQNSEVRAVVVYSTRVLPCSFDVMGSVPANIVKKKKKKKKRCQPEVRG